MSGEELAGRMVPAEIAEQGSPKGRAVAAMRCMKQRPANTIDWEGRLTESCEDAMSPEGKTTEERFAAIREFFLEQLKMAGSARRELYRFPKPGAPQGEPTERDVVLEWARCQDAALNDVLFGIQRAFEKAEERGDVVTSFRYCVPHITNAAVTAAKRRTPL